jgi:RNA polymerase Rpb3/Rpb11 dimerisation domain
MVSSGVYEVQEDGLKWKHDVQQRHEEVPGTPEEFLDKFRHGFEMRVLERPCPDTLILEFNHVDVSFVNALRRILLSEVPTVAIETVYMWNNTSLIHDEVLAHRLGLIPIFFDARRLMGFDEADGFGQAGNPTDRNTIVFRLHIGCDQEDVEEDHRRKQERKRNQKAASKKPVGVDEDSEDEGVVSKSTHPALEEATAGAARAKQHEAKANDKNIPKRPYTKHVYSGDMEWLPQNDQVHRKIGIQTDCLRHHHHPNPLFSFPPSRRNGSRMPELDPSMRIF